MRCCFLDQECKLEGNDCIADTDTGCRKLDYMKRIADSLEAIAGKKYEA